MKRPLECITIIALLIGLMTSQNIHDRRCPVHRCSLPTCRCSHSDSPGDLMEIDIPQMVIFTFDDAVTKRDYEFFQMLFAEDRVNPNGCPITMTMFIQDNFTDYGLVKLLYNRGMEAAVHSVTHKTPTDFWKNPSEKELRDEIVNQRNNLHRKAGIPLEKLQGWRSPFLQSSGEKLYDILKREKFAYDSTLTTSRREYNDNLWPFTLDYGWPLTCEVQPCPENRYAGLWEFPIAPLLARTKNRLLSYTYVDSYRPTTSREAYEFLKKNFDSYYKGYREPFMINMHTAWFYFRHNLYGLDLFIRELLTLDDVFIVNVQQALSWIKQPVPLKYAKTFTGWTCGKPTDRPKPTVKPTMFVPPTPAPTTRDPQAAKRDIICIQGVNCTGPDCRCDTIFEDNKITKAEIPQFVLLTFDDAVNLQNQKFYNRLFSPDRLNPNGCQISMTLFLQHKYTDYSVVKKLYEQGMEIAVHSVTHRTPNEWWTNASRAALTEEVQGMRKNIKLYTGIPEHHVVGWRSPFLQPTGDTLFQILKEHGFHYDSTLSVNRLSFETHQVWPFTLDFGWKRDCAVPKCPNNFYPGIWEFPVVALIDPVTKHPCTYVDSCRPNTKTKSLHYLMRNFMEYYENSRAPFMLNMHAAWFLLDENLDAMDEFIKQILKKKDVYIVTVSQALEWMRTPTKIQNMNTFKPFACGWRPSMAPSGTDNSKRTTKSINSSLRPTHKDPDKNSNNKENSGETSDTPVYGGSDDISQGNTNTKLGLEWYVILLIALVVFALLVVGVLLTVSIVKKHQVVRVSRLAQLAATMTAKQEEEASKNEISDRALTLEALKSISQTNAYISDNVYTNIMEMRKASSRKSDSEKNRSTEYINENVTTYQNRRQNIPLPKPPSQEALRTRTFSKDRPMQSRSSTAELTINTRGLRPNRYEGDLEAVRNSVINDLNQFSQNHARMSVASIENQYQSIDDPWLNLNLQSGGDNNSID